MTWQHPAASLDSVSFTPAAQHGLLPPVSSALVQILSLELSPAEFEERVLGTRQDWRQSLLVEAEQQDQQDCMLAVPLGQWLQQQGIEVDDQGRASGLTRFARDAASEPQPCLSGPASLR